MYPIYRVQSLAVVAVYYTLVAGKSLFVASLRLQQQARLDSLSRSLLLLPACVGRKRLLERRGSDKQPQSIPSCTTLAGLLKRRDLSVVVGVGIFGGRRPLT